MPRFSQSMGSVGNSPEATLMASNLSDNLCACGSPTLEWAIVRRSAEPWPIRPKERFVHRLRSRHPDLHQAFSQLQLSRVRHIVAMTCLRATQVARLKDPNIDKAVQHLVAGTQITNKELKAVRRVVHRLDMKYFHLADSGGNFASVFQQARAAAAVQAAHEGDSLDDAMNAVYEAIFAFGNEPAFIDLINAMIKQSSAQPS